MRRTPISHVVFPRPSLLRPVPEFAWEAVRALMATDDLDVTVLMPVPARPLRSLHSAMRRARGALAWPEGLEERLLALEPRPTLVRYAPMPGRSTESAAAAIAAHLVARPRAGRPRVLHGSFLDEGGYAAAQVAHVLGAASIIVAHGTDVRAACGQLERARGRQRRALEAARRAGRVVAVSHDLAGQLARVGVRAEVLPFTARADRFTSSPLPRGAPEILFVGRVGPDKGVDLLLEAFARLSGSDATLRLVGPAVAGFDARELATRLGVEARVHFHGEVAQADLPDLYRNATCMALPSQHEGLPCVVVESLLTGRPVVASDVGGMRELVDASTGALVPDGTAESFAGALSSVLSASSAGRFDPVSLRARALPFAWESVGPRLAQLTRALVA